MPKFGSTPPAGSFTNKKLRVWKRKIQGFLKHWSQNDSPIESSYTPKIQSFYHHFYRSECVSLGKEAIDKMVAFVQQLQKDYDLELLDKMNACFKQGTACTIQISA
jgi:hypothetical protein